MAEFTFPCPLCGQVIETDDQWCGQDGPCPHCDQVVQIPPKPDNPFVFWYILNDEQQGPVEPEILVDLIKKGTLSQSVMVLQPGMTAWRKAKDIPLLKTLLSQTDSKKSKSGLRILSGSRWGNSNVGGPTNGSGVNNDATSNCQIGGIVFTEHFGVHGPFLPILLVQWAYRIGRIFMRIGRVLIFIGICWLLLGLIGYFVHFKDLLLQNFYIFLLGLVGCVGFNSIPLLIGCVFYLSGLTYVAIAQFLEMINRIEYNTEKLFLLMRNRNN